MIALEKEFPSRVVRSEKKKLTLYSKDNCPYCVLAKNLLDSIGASYEEVDVTDNQKLLMEIAAKSRMRTVPQVFL
jgi:glutaredoxin 3